MPLIFRGAMENTAVIFIARRFCSRTRRVGRNTTGRREVLAHEIAHQWFGDLVTMQVGRHLAERGVCQLMETKPLKA
jgi:aminopeptidase N